MRSTLKPTHLHSPADDLEGQEGVRRDDVVEEIDAWSHGHQGCERRREGQSADKLHAVVRFFRARMSAAPTPHEAFRE